MEEDLSREASFNASSRVGPEEVTFQKKPAVEEVLDRYSDIDDLGKEEQSVTSKESGKSDKDLELPMKN
jgi:hypothetical protein